MPVLQRLELVCERVPLSNRTLRNAIDTIHLHGTELTDAVPMNGRAVGIIVILDMDDQFVAPTSFDQGSWVRLVEDLATGLFETVCVDLHNGEFAIGFTLSVPK